MIGRTLDHYRSTCTRMFDLKALVQAHIGEKFGQWRVDPAVAFVQRRDGDEDPRAAVPLGPVRK